MKSALFSVRPEWCRKIATGEKTIEVRKTAPNLATPYKGYLYCTLSGCNELFRDVLRGDIAAWNRENWGLRKGRVWAEFICDADLPLLFSCSDPEALTTHYEVPGTCLSDVEIMKYLGNGKKGHGLHISNLQIYDKPRELSEFRCPCENDLYCESCGMYAAYTEACGNAALYLRRPPQSWCYVEERENDR